MSEFKHYGAHQHRPDPDNCSACALEIPVMIDGKMGINYAGWPLSYMQNGRRIPQKFMRYLVNELSRTDKLPYLNNLKTKLKEHGYDIEIILREYGNEKMDN